MKILLLNFGYGLGLNGSFSDYLKKGYRYLYCPESVKRKSLEKLNQLIAKEKPDIICLLEIKKDQIYDLPFEYITFRNKYGPKNILSSLPVSENNGNAVLSNTPLKIQTRYLPHGLKKLVYEIEIGDIRLFLGHFALLSPSVRMKQFTKLAEQFTDQEKIIVCGDFNIDYPEELHPFLNKLKIANTEFTYPVCDPEKAIDLFLHSPNINISNCRVLDDQISDHLSVMLEIK